MDINQKNISLYVSCDGCDECGNGSIEKPFATVPAAQKVVRDAIKNGGLESDAYIFVPNCPYIGSQPFNDVASFVLLGFRLNNLSNHSIFILRLTFGILSDAAYTFHKVIQV